MECYLTLFVSNTMRVEVEGLGAFSAVNSFDYINDATVTVTIVDSTGTEVAGETWPVTLSYESASNGNYSGVVSKDIAVSDGDLLTAKLTVTSGSNVGYWEPPVEVDTRTHRSGFG